MGVGDVYEVVDVQSMHGQQVLNAYYYYQALPTLPLEGTIGQALADAFAEDIVPAICEVQHSDCQHLTVRCRNLFDPFDAGEAITGINGLRLSGDSMAAFDGYGMTINHDSTGIRPGGKRFAGVSEADVEDGVPNGTQITRLDTLAAVLAEPIPSGIIIQTDTMYPVVVQRIKEGEEGAYTYRLPVSQLELVYGTVLEILVKAFVTSQVSRKPGVGV